MTLRTAVIIAVVSLAGTILVIGCVHLVWRLISLYKVKRAGPAPLSAHTEAVWRDPGRVEALDFVAGPGGPDGAPAPPFRFVEENSSGSSPNITVQDSKGRIWRVKWGDEVQSETFAVRLAWAAGYFVETTYYVSQGRVEGASTLERARECVAEDGSFTHARFELDDKRAKKMFDEHGWAWNDNPFVGTTEFNGLKVVMMLLSNWDNKDVRDVARGSNTAIFEYELPNGLVEARYLIIDWGGSMGRWGNVVFREKWDCEGFAAQTPAFVTGVDEGIVLWGYSGQRTDDAAVGITVDDVRWLWQYVGRITDDQLRDGLRASGATGEEIVSFVDALRNRLDQLRRVSDGAWTAPTVSV